MMIRALLGAVILGSLGVATQDPAALAPPHEVRFDSVDYRNILCWTPPTNSTRLHYYVQWKIYGQPDWLDMASCQGIQKLRCDLSNVTSVPREWYYARVHASSFASSKSAWALSPRFSPRWNTKISPPGLKLNVMEQGVWVRVKPPKQHIRKMHSSLQYRIYLIHPSGKEELFVMECCSKRIALSHLKHKTKYCLQAQIIIVHQAKSSARSSKKCVTTLG